MENKVVQQDKKINMLPHILSGFSSKSLLQNMDTKKCNISIFFDKTITSSTNAVFLFAINVM
jgi:hypothetical protein